MVMTSPYRVVLTGTDRQVLEGWVRAGSTPQRTVLRALIVLMAADGDSNAHIAAEPGVCVDTSNAEPMPEARHHHYQSLCSDDNVFGSYIAMRR